MKHQHGEDVPVKGFLIRSPFAVMILNPFQLPLTLALAVASIVFTIWPRALQHSPIGFETRGFLHHVWHYSLLVGSVLTLAGMFWTDSRRLRAELSGLFILMGSVAMNLIALLAWSSTDEMEGPPSGFGLALRLGILLGLASRAFIIATAPVVTVKAPPGETVIASLPSEAVAPQPSEDSV